MIVEVEKGGEVVVVIVKKVAVVTTAAEAVVVVCASVRACVRGGCRGNEGAMLVCAQVLVYAPN